MMSSFYLHHQSISGQRRPPRGTFMHLPPSSCRYHPGSSKEVESHPRGICFAFHWAGLPEHRVNGILDRPRKPGPEGIIVKMRKTEILLDDVSLLRYLFVSLFFVVRQFCRGSLFSHDAIRDLVHSEKGPVWFSKVSFVGVYLLNGFFGMMLATNAAMAVAIF